MSRNLTMVGLSVVYRIIILAVAFFTAKAAWITAADKSRFLHSFSGATELVYYVFLAGSALGFVALVGLFHYRRWGVWIFAGLALLATILNVAAEAPSAHTAAGLALSLIILGLAAALRKRFQ